MAWYTVKAAEFVRGSPLIPGDKSISHRGLIFGALASGVTQVKDILKSGDVQSTEKCLKELGVKIYESGGTTFVEGVGMKFSKPLNALDCGNSGTTMRLLMGVLSTQDFISTLSGDASLSKRPMKRVAAPLREMGAVIQLTEENYAPLTVTGRKLHRIDFDLKIASAQIKTAVMLAALGAEGVTNITGEIESRDHTERLLKYFGANLQTTSTKISIIGNQKLTAQSLQVPGDPSTAAFWIAAASLLPKSQIELKNISLNPTRTGFIEVLKRMGAKIHTEMTSTEPEPIGNLKIVSSSLQGTIIKAGEIPSLIDEIPILAVLASQAHGVTEVQGAAELRVKESDRLDAIAVNLKAMGVKIEMKPDGFIIEGRQSLRGASIESFHDHRIAMAFSIAGLLANGDTQIAGSECVAISYPDFYNTLERLTAG